MKTVTQNFTDAQKQPAPVMVRQVWYKRRYWSETSKAYIWEGSWTQYTEDKVVEVSEITWQLDIQTLSEFKTSNVTITLENLNNQWREDNPYGVFAKNTASPIFGYHPFWMKFQIRAGLQFGSTKTTEVVSVFTGVATDYNYDSQSGAVQITLTGEEAILLGSSAEGVSTTVTNESATGSVDGANKVFTTAHNGVGIVTEVSDNGATKRAGTDYTLSQLNDSANPGKVTFLVAPAAGHTVRVSYLYWKTSQKFEDLVTALLNQAGIAGANQQVSPVIFSSNIINTHVWQTQADWVGGVTLTNLDTNSIPNSIEFLYSQSPTWNSSTSGWTTAITHGTFAGDSSGLTLTSVNVPGDVGSPYELVGSMYRANTGGYGTWTLPFNWTIADWNLSIPTFYFDFFISSLSAGAISTGYLIQVQRSSGSIAANISLLRKDAANPVGVTFGGSAYNTTNAALTGSHTITVKNHGNGTFNVYLDGALIITATDTTYASCNYFGYSFNLTSTNGTGAKTLILGNSGFTAAISPTALASWRSATVDFGSTPTAFSQFVYAQTLNSGTTTYYTRTSADNISFDAWTVVPANGVIASILRRYIQSRVDIDITSGDPVVSSITVGSITGSTVITLANFTGMTCYDAITALAKFANYEFGFDASENFFFRPKNPGNTAVFTLTESDLGMTVVSKVPGYDRVYSRIRASYAGYIKDIADDGLMYLDPLPSYGYNLLQIDGGSILVSADADVATGLAGSFFNYYRRPRRRVKIQTLAIPQLDISDVISVSFQDLHPARWYIGDTSTYIGDATKSLYGPEEQLISPLNMKVIGMRIDTNNWMTEFDLEEVL